MPRNSALSQGGHCNCQKDSSQHLSISRCFTLKQCSTLLSTFALKVCNHWRIFGQRKKDQRRLLWMPRLRGETPIPATGIMKDNHVIELPEEQDLENPSGPVNGVERNSCWRAAREQHIMPNLYSMTNGLNRSSEECLGHQGNGPQHQW